MLNESGFYRPSKWKPRGQRVAEYLGIPYENPYAVTKTISASGTMRRPTEVEMASWAQRMALGVTNVSVSDQMAYYELLRRNAVFLRAEFQQFFDRLSR